MYVAANETKQVLKEMISELVRKSWNATRFMTEEMKGSRRSDLRKLWADGSLTDFDHHKGPVIDFTQRDVAGTSAEEGF